MPDPISRRDAIRRLGVAGAGLALTGATIRGRIAEIVVAGRPVELSVASVSPRTVRLTLRALENGAPDPLRFTGALADEGAATQLARTSEDAEIGRVRAGDLLVRFSPTPPTIHVETTTGETVQTLRLSATEPGMAFALPDGPLLGMGEGGPQFDRRGERYEMRNGQRGYELATHGTRSPFQWLIGTTDGWAMFIHQPYGTFDLTGSEGLFTPDEETPLPLDVFVVHASDPERIMREYALITGFPEIPALWTLGYQQSSRTLAGPEEILGVARTFREKGLPCDTLIYLGTGFAPSGWNTANGEFTWNPDNFPDPPAMISELHDEHFRVVVHIVVEGQRFIGSVHDPCTAAGLPSGRYEDEERGWPPERQCSCYWPHHEPIMAAGVDGWWPDQGDGFDGPSRFNRHRMYYEGTLLYRPNERPFALHRNASPGVQRFGSYIWSGDPRSRWETLRTHVAVGINTGLSGLPYWGSDIGGFTPTDEYTGELHVRWFQFGAFCPSFRAHGRNWHLKLPWGWDGGDGGPFETGDWRVAPEELRNPEIEPIIKKYLELRYQLIPYLYTAMKDATETGLPIIRSLWLHAPDDPVAVARSDEYMWGSDMLVAPVVEPAVDFRRLYLPRGTWYDFWTEEAVFGGREIERAVDLETMPLYVRAGTVLPMGPAKQYTSQPTDEQTTLVVYPGADGWSSLYEDDGITFDYRQGAYMRVDMEWRDDARRLTLRLREGSRMLGSQERTFGVRLAGESEVRSIRFSGTPAVMDL